ncbi:MAG: GntR family transcriptional regulator [Lachnospiraceae bacterium]|nr:GntR family transcriptional regulator [Lachnospiraceae bacterium]
MEPAYRRMYEALKIRIVQGEYAIGSMLPSELELEREFGISRTTVRRAIELLSRDGFIVVKQGFGTQVVSRKVSQSLNHVNTVGDALEMKGHKTGIKSCYIERIPADAALASMMNIPIGTPLICIHRIRTSDGIPACIMKNYILASWVPEIEKELMIDKLYEFLREKYGIVYSALRNIVSACNASYEESQLLEVEPKTALMTVNRQCYVNGVVVALDHVRIIASMYEYEVYTETGNDRY